MKDTDVKRGRYGSFVLDIRMYLHSPYADFHTPYADFHSQGLKFKVQSHSLYLDTILVASLHNIRYALILYSLRPNRVNTVRQPSKHGSPTELTVQKNVIFQGKECIPRTVSLVLFTLLPLILLNIPTTNFLNSNLHSQPSQRDNTLTIIRLS